MVCILLVTYTIRVNPVKLVFVLEIIGTGTEKALSFFLPFEKLSAEGFIRNDQGQPPPVLTMTPTGELAIQVFRK